MLAALVTPSDGASFCAASRMSMRVREIARAENSDGDEKPPVGLRQRAQPFAE